MTDQEQLAGYDDDGTDGTPDLGAHETAPSVPPASSPELSTLVAVAVGTIVVATLYISPHPRPHHAGGHAVLRPLSAC
jgi:hypothetical protein